MVERIYTIDEIKELLYPLLHAVPVSSAILFGSYARNEATAKSDIDLFVDSGGHLRGLNFVGFCDEISSKIQKPVDVFEKHYIDPTGQLYQTILSEGVVIYD